jgi:hypothetical protein
MLRLAPCWLSVAVAFCWSAEPAFSQPNKLPVPQYDEKAEKWGYVIADGKTVVKSIPAKFTAALPFSPVERLAVVKGGEKGKEKYWFIDTNGDNPFRREFDFAGPFREGVARVRNEKKFALFFKDGTEGVGFVYDDLGDVRNGLIRAQQEGTYRFLRTNGEIAFKTDYTLVGDFSAGDVANSRAWFRDKDGFGYIGPDGKPAFEGRFEAAGTFSSGLAAVRRDGVYAYIDTKGKPAFDAKYQLARPFVGPLAAVQRDGKLGVIDTRGNEVIKLEYDQVDLLTPTTGLVRKGDKLELFQRDTKNGAFTFQAAPAGRWVSVPIKSVPDKLEVYMLPSTQFESQSPVENHLDGGRGRIGETNLPNHAVEKGGWWVFVVVSKDKKDGKPVWKHQYFNPNAPNPKPIEVTFP